jgi:hypothetical protein
MNTPPAQLGPPLLILGCTRHKRPTLIPVPALNLYEGGCVPQLRRRLGHGHTLRARVRILSAEHGLISAEEPLLPYDRVLTDRRAAELGPQVSAALRQVIDSSGPPEELLIVAEPRYQALVTAALDGPLARPKLRTISDVRDWDAVSAVLDTWGWP